MLIQQPRIFSVFILLGGKQLWGCSLTLLNEEFIPHNTEWVLWWKNQTTVAHFLDRSWDTLTCRNPDRLCILIHSSTWGDSWVKNRCSNEQNSYSYSLHYHYLYILPREMFYDNCGYKQGCKSYSIQNHIKTWDNSEATQIFTVIRSVNIDVKGSKSGHVRGQITKLYIYIQEIDKRVTLRLCGHEAAAQFAFWPI